MGLAVFYLLEEEMYLSISPVDDRATVQICVIYPCELQTILKHLKPLPALPLFELISLNLFFLPGEWTLFLPGRRQEASGADRGWRCDSTTKPTIQGKHHVPLCRPHAPTGVPAPLQAERRICIPLQTR